MGIGTEVGVELGVPVASGGVGQAVGVDDSKSGAEMMVSGMDVEMDVAVGTSATTDVGELHAANTSSNGAMLY